MNKKLIWKGFFGKGSGISHAAQSIVESMIDEGMDVGVLPLHDIRGNPLEQYSVKDLDNSFIVLHSLPTVDPNADGYYVVYELETCPEEWWIPLRNAKVIITQSEFCREIFERIPGIDKSKIHVVNFPIDDSFTPNGPELKRMIKNQKSGMFLEDYDFVFGSIFEWVARKKPELMWQAFMEEFPLEDYPNVGFINKISIPNGHPHDFRNWRMFVPKDPRIMIMFEKIDDISMFYRTLDCYCSPTAGEGWGATLMEAMACGTPVIGSRHSGNLDFMDDENSYLVDVGDWQEVGNDPVNVMPHILKPHHRWKLPKIESIRKAMREVYETKMNNEENIKVKKALQIKKKYTKEKIGKQLKSIMKNYV